MRIYSTEVVRWRSGDVVVKLTRVGSGMSAIHLVYALTPESEFQIRLNMWNTQEAEALARALFESLAWIWRGGEDVGDAKDVTAGSDAPGGPDAADKRGNPAVGGAGVLREHGGVDGGVRVAHRAGGVCGADGAGDVALGAGASR